MNLLVAVIHFKWIFKKYLTFKKLEDNIWVNKLYVHKLYGSVDRRRTGSQTWTIRRLYSFHLLSIPSLRDKNLPSTRRLGATRIVPLPKNLSSGHCSCCQASKKADSCSGWSPLRSRLSESVPELKGRNTCWRRYCRNVLKHYVHKLYGWRYYLHLRRRALKLYICTLV